ncbi:Transposable element Tc3 transposase [Frankliniella fusca]|uniref:Transposable element Tc3 transposase n=1 Tax=Frankliniella fusca TaxID=407009 RepID=A0AAE1HMN5_9NEOP|nr:Transposable element Tc3 transposase [Frankliniella fusca]
MGDDRLTNQNKFDMMMVYGEFHQNSRRAAAAYAERFPPPHPRHQLFHELGDRLRARGTFAPNVRAEDRAARQRPRRDPVAIALVRQTLEASPHTSVRVIARLLGMTRTTVHDIMKKDLRWRPWKRWKCQELKPQDKPIRARACEELLDRIDEAENNPEFPGDIFINRVIWSDECTITNEGYFNSHNAHHWAPEDENPHCTVVTNIQGRWKVNVWAGVLHNKIVGPFFFDEAVNQYSYRRFLRNELPALLEDFPLHIRRVAWFMQDAAPGHTAHRVRRCLNHRRRWRGRWIGKFSPNQNWPVRSPDLTPCDFWLWGTLKDRLFPADGVRYENPEELKAAITRECRAISEDEIASVFTNMERRIGCCLIADGGHFEHLL